MIKIVAICTSLILASVSPSSAGETASSPGAVQYFVNLRDFAEVTSPIKVIFGLSGMGVAPAGVDKPNTGHHHILLDRAPLGEGKDGKDELDVDIISDENNIHFNKGQTETTLELEPGIHTIQLVLGDKDHIPHNPPVFSEVITVIVK
ncbi:MAG: DUF4399 domain-containing protein [Hyphomicrobiales bacterium]|nr:DUF4399 domain-containing protein [Hyphomicrobiales bacterium]